VFVVLTDCTNLKQLSGKTGALLRRAHGCSLAANILTVSEVLLTLTEVFSTNYNGTISTCIRLPDTKHSGLALRPRARHQFRLPSCV